MLALKRKIEVVEIINVLEFTVCSWIVLVMLFSLCINLTLGNHLFDVSKPSRERYWTKVHAAIMCVYFIHINYSSLSVVQRFVVTEPEKRVLPLVTPDGEMRVRLMKNNAILCKSRVQYLIVFSYCKANHVRYDCKLKWGNLLKAVCSVHKKTEKFDGQQFRCEYILKTIKNNSSSPDIT